MTSWQQYRNEEQRLNDWLYEKEKSLKAISVIDMGDKIEVQKQLQKLKVLFYVSSGLYFMLYCHNCAWFWT